MDNKTFKKNFGEIAKKHGFISAFGGWYKQSAECIFTLDLQKSYYSNLYYLNMKTYIQGTFDKTYIIAKEMMKADIGNIFRRQPVEYNDAFDLEKSLADEERIQLLQSLFENFIIPYSNQSLTRKGIRELADQKLLSLLPAVDKELTRIMLTTSS